MPDPLHWYGAAADATSAPAEETADAAAIRKALVYRSDLPAHDGMAALDRLVAALAARTTERDQARDALKRYGKHRHGCRATATAGGMFRPGPCTCGLAAVLAVGAAQQEAASAAEETPR